MLDAALLQVAEVAVRQAALVCQSVQSGISGDALEKKDRSPVTIADFASQALICRTLHEAFPDHGIIAEEDSKELRDPSQGEFVSRILNEFDAIGVSAAPDELFRWIDYGGSDEGGEAFWTLDPIDGTKGFLRGEQYAISLAHIVGGEVVLAVVGCPNLPFDPDGDDKAGTILTAQRGEGAYAKAFLKNESHTRIGVTNEADPTLARVCESVESGHSSHSDSARIADHLGIDREPVRLDSQAKYAVVARGQADIYLRLPTRPGYVEKIWDHAGGMLLVEEAGGTVTDIDGKPLDFSLGRGLSENRGVVVTNGPLHGPVLETIRELGIGGA